MNTQSTADTKEKAASKYNPLPHLRRWQGRISKHPASYLFYAFLLPVCIMFGVYLAMELHPFGDGSVLVLDLNGQYVYFFEALRNFVRGDASLLYSFSRSLGGEFMGIYAYYLASPLSYIVALFPTKRMLEALLVLILLKTGLCGYTFGFYLHKNSRHPNKMAVIAFSVMYSLCAYAVVYQNNVMWIDALIWLPIITYSIEQLVKFGKYKLFVISLAVAIMSNFYIGYMICIYVALYFFYYSFAYGDGRNNPLGRKNNFVRSLIRIAFFSAIAVAISAVIILTAYYALTFGKTTFTDPSWKLVDNFPILDFLTKFLPGSYDTVRPEGLPYVYAGTLMLLLVPVYFVAKKIPLREKLGSLILVLFFVLCFIASPLDLIWHGFQRPNWLNYRYSFMLVFILLVLAYKGFANLRRVGEKFLLGVGAIIILFVAVAQKQEFVTYVESDGKLLTFGTVWATVIAVVCLVATLAILIKTKNVFKRENVCTVLAALVCIEIFCSSLICVVQHDGDVVYSGYSGYNDHLNSLRPIVQAVKDNDTTFYRMEKTSHRTTNDNMALDMAGVSNSTSTLDASTIKLLDSLGYSSVSHWSKYSGGTPVNDSLLGIKYIIDKDYPDELGSHYQKVYESGEYSAYLNHYALSVAYGVDKQVNEFKIDDYKTNFHRLNALVTAMLGTDGGTEIEIFKPISVDSITTEHCASSSVYRHTQYSNTSDSSDGTVTYTITSPIDGELYMEAVTEYPREISLSVNNISIGRALDSGTNRIISLGYFKAGEQVEVTLEIINDYDVYYAGTYADYFYYIDNGELERSFSALKSFPQFNVNEGYTDDCLEGTIVTDYENRMILTTIPYDRGWQVYLDGERIETYETLDSLMAFDIANEGEHTLTLRYRSDAYIIGLTVSLAGIAVFAAVCVSELVINRLRRRKNAVPDTPHDILWELEDFDEDYEQYKTDAKPIRTEEASLVDKLRTRLKQRKKEGNEEQLSEPNDTENKDNENNGGN